MEVVYYERRVGGISPHNLSYAKCFFVPDKNALLVKEECGALTVYSLVFNQLIFNEAKAIAQGKDPYKKERA